MGARARPDARRRAGVLGELWLPQLRRPVARAALSGRQVIGAPSPVRWRLGAVLEVIEETPHAKTIVLEVPDWPGHVAGQHVDIRLTAEDGYQTERSYSIGSPPEQSTVELTVERIDDGEVSPYLTEELRVGDELELRGPIGGYFNWRNENGGPLLLIAGGSGLVPLMAMLRHRAATASTVDARLLLSARSLEDVLYREELGKLAAGDGLAVHYTLTREPPAGLGRVRPADRCGDVDDGRTGSGARAADLRVRAVRVRRAGCRCPRPALGHPPLRSEPSDSAPRADVGSWRRRQRVQFPGGHLWADQALSPRNAFAGIGASNAACARPRPFAQASKPGRPSASSSTVSTSWSQGCAGRRAPATRGGRTTSAIAPSRALRSSSFG